MLTDSQDLLLEEEDPSASAREELEHPSIKQVVSRRDMRGWRMGLRKKLEQKSGSLVMDTRSSDKSVLGVPGKPGNRPKRQRPGRPFPHEPDLRVSRSLGLMI